MYSVAAFVEDQAGAVTGEAIQALGRCIERKRAGISEPMARLRALARLPCDSQSVLVFLSRSLNVLAGGSPRELFCARAHRKGWAVCPYIDALFRVIRADDKEHCRACFLGDKRSKRLRQRGLNPNLGPQTGINAAPPQARPAAD